MLFNDGGGGGAALVLAGAIAAKMVIDTAPDAAQALEQMIPPAVPREQEGFNLPATEGSGYNPGPPVWGGSELTEPVLPGPPVGVQEPTSIPGFSLDPGVVRENILLSTTGRGIKRDNVGFFKRMLEEYPDILGEESKAEIDAGRMPYVDENWVQYFPEHEPYLGEKLTVHHVLQWIEKAIPRSEHRDHHMPGGTRHNPGNP